jgi:hypothetical protein
MQGKRGQAGAFCRKAKAEAGGQRLWFWVQPGGETR